MVVLLDAVVGKKNQYRSNVFRVLAGNFKESCCILIQDTIDFIIKFLLVLEMSVDGSFGYSNACDYVLKTWII